MSVAIVTRHLDGGWGEALMKMADIEPPVEGEFVVVLSPVPCRWAKTSPRGPATDDDLCSRAGPSPCARSHRRSCHASGNRSGARFFVSGDGIMMQPCDVPGLFLSMDVLSEAEIRRGNSFKVPEDADAYRWVHSILRYCLGAWLGVAPREVPLCVTSGGKPFLGQVCGSLPGYCFSLSRRPGLVALVFSVGCAVGIDVEPFVQSDVLRGWIPGVFTAGERAWVSSAVDSEDGLGRMLQIWTLREALAKGLGLGLAGMGDVSEVLPSDQRFPADWTTWPIRVGVRDWWVGSAVVEKLYRVSLAMEGTGRIRVITIDR